MSKKHFIKVANVLRVVKESKSTASFGADYAIAIITLNLAEIFEEANPRFDRAKFLEACNVKH